MIGVSLVFSRSNGLMSSLIRLVTRRAISHVAIGLTVEGVRLVVEASFLGVEMTERKCWLRANSVVEEYLSRRALDVRGALHALGEAYDYGGLLGRLWMRLRHLRRNPFGSPRRVICSELVLALRVPG